MKTLALLLAMSSGHGAQPRLCTPITDVSSAKWSCCSQPNGQQCCSQTTDSDGNPSGCDC